uniref:class I SAM-dependent methyltransferase n=1 Tax=unclassified Streptomyces TaxID=2593676 RepID=UPI00267AAB0C
MADLSDPLPFTDAAFDDVLASLVLYYLKDWGPTLAEMRRVLRVGGRLIASVQYPFVDYAIQILGPTITQPPTTSRNGPTWQGQAAHMSFWRRPLHSMTDAFACGWLPPGCDQ